jgi:hypothetical protein
MNTQVFQKPKKIRKSFRLFFLILSSVLFAATIKAYLSIRLELMEARGVLSDVLFSTCVISKALTEGDVDKALALSITNQLKGIQYAIRREVKDANIDLATEYCFREGNLPLNDEQRSFYFAYAKNYRDWESSGWLDDNHPLMAQMMDVLYYYWADCRPRWTTWKPRDYATNIKVGSPEERSRKRQPRLEDQVPIDEKLRRALENVNAESDSDEGAENDH